MVQKRYTKQLHIRLAKELASLRKGEGITPAKLQEKITLRTVAARATRVQLDSITNHQVYDFLLTEVGYLPNSPAFSALRNAFGITNTSGRLSFRRAHLARELNKHTDTIERYENHGIDNLATALLERESSILKTTPSQTPSYVQELEKQTTALRQMVSTGLSAHLSLGSRSEDLIKYLELSRTPYLDTTVHLSFLPSSRGSQWYRFKLAYYFQGARNVFRVAVVLDSKDGEHLMQAGLIDDFHQLNDPTRATREISTIIANSKFILKDPSASTQKLLRLKELEPATALRLLRSADTSFAKPCRLLEIEIPANWQLPQVTYEYHSIVNLRAAEHYAYWYSPGLMFLKKLTFDFSQFPDADWWQFHVQSFMGHTTGTLLENERIYTLQSNSWIMPGHGISLVWQEP